jgi:hypothetical protein
MATRKRRPKLSFHERTVGPRVVGGRYMCGYWRKSYIVLDFKVNDDNYDWYITVCWDDDYRVGTHSTCWDPKSDRVISAPEGV